MDDNSPSYPADPAGSMQYSGLVGLVVLIVFIPVIVVLVLIGLIYEGVIRIDRSRKLPAAVHWALATVVGLALLVVLAPIVFRWLLPPIA